MFKTLESSDKSLRVIETFKTFVSTNNDSGSGVFAVKARSGSFRNYVSSSDENTPIVSGSVTTNFFGQPTHHLINTRYYKFFDFNRPKEGNYVPFDIFKYSHQSRSLHISSSVFSISRNLYGEKIKPGSIKLTDTSNGKTFDIRDDGDGALQIVVSKI